MYDTFMDALLSDELAQVPPNFFCAVCNVHIACLCKCNPIVFSTSFIADPPNFRGRLTIDRNVNSCPSDSVGVTSEGRSASGA